MPLGTELGLSPGDFVLDGDPAPSQNMGRSAPPQYRPMWPNGSIDQDDTWHGGGPWSRPQCARWEPAPLPKKGAKPHPPFSAHFYCRQTAGWIKMALNGMEVGLGPGDFVFDGDPAFPQKKGHSPSTQFLAHVYCDQTAGWIKMPYFVRR